MTGADFAIRQAAILMAARMRLFKRIAEQSKEAESRIDMDPRELWDSADEAALAAYELALNEINGARPLPMDLSA